MVLQGAQQPNIQVTGSNIPPPTADPVTATVVNNGRVANSGSFNYTTTKQGGYAIVFDNTFSTTAAKSINATYYVAGSKFIKSFIVAPGHSQDYSYVLAANVKMYGKFNVTGGGTNDIDFFIAVTTCTSTATFSFTLVNLSSVNGLATVTLTVDGLPQWSNRYYVPGGAQVPGGGGLPISDCNAHILKLSITSQDKA
jgi:hypothetical protein